MGVLGELSVVAGRVEDVDYARSNLSFRLGEQPVDMSIPSGRQDLFRSGSEMEFVVRRKLLYGRSLTARAWRDKSGKIHSARTSHHWIGVLCGVVGAWLWGPGCFRGDGCSLTALTHDNIYLWVVPFWFVYAVLALIESRQAMRMLRAA